MIENPSKATTLRQRAEEQMNKRSSETSPQLLEEDILKLNHELQVHQFELEMQNEELIQAKEESDRSFGAGRNHCHSPVKTTTTIIYKL